MPSYNDSPANKPLLRNPRRTIQSGGMMPLRPAPMPRPERGTSGPIFFVTHRMWQKKCFRVTPCR